MMVADRNPTLLLRANGWTDIPLISESDVDGEERRGEDDAEGGDDGQRGEDGHADPRRLHSLDGPVSGRLFALRHPRDGRLVEEERVAGVLVFGDGHLVGPNDLLHRQPAAAFVILEFDSALQQPKTTQLFRSEEPHWTARVP